MIRSAIRRQQRQKRTADVARGTARRLWGAVDPGAVVPSWRETLPRMLSALIGIQVAAAQSADTYVEEALSAQNLDLPPGGAVNPSGLAGYASDGWPLMSLLLLPAVEAARLMNEGMPSSRALAVGQFSLEMMAATQTADAFRIADSVASTSRRVQMYARVLGPNPCSRCIILAGDNAGWSTAYLRHPNCSCTAVPTDWSRIETIVPDPNSVFESMSEADQDRVFGRSGAQAIRDGADMSRVVNARRRASGMRSASDYERTRRWRRRRGTEWAQMTAAEGTVRGRGRLRRRQTLAGDRFVTFEDPLSLPGGGVAPRLMPESIYEIAEDQDHAIRLLKRHGYIQESYEEWQVQFEADREASRERARTNQPGYGRRQ